MDNIQEYYNANALILALELIFFILILASIFKVIDLLDKKFSWDLESRITKLFERWFSNEN